MTGAEAERLLGVRGPASGERAGSSGSRAGSGVWAVVLAGGCATRMGRQKLLLPIGGRPLIRWVTDAATASRTQETIVVTGWQGDEVRDALIGQPVRIVFNPAYAYGQSTSLRAGIAAVDPSCRAALFLVGDQPFVTASIIDQFVAEFDRTHCLVVRASVDGSPAHPVLMSSELFPELLEQRGDVGGRHVAESRAAETRVIELDATSAMDVDSLDEYELAKRLA